MFLTEAVVFAQARSIPVPLLRDLKPHPHMITTPLDGLDTAQR